MDFSLHFGLGQHQMIDSLVVEWLTGEKHVRYNIAVNNTMILDKSDAIKNWSIQSNKDNVNISLVPHNELNIDFMHKENNFNDFQDESLLPYMQSTLGPFIFCW